MTIVLLLFVFGIVALVGVAAHQVQSNINDRQRERREREADQRRVAHERRARFDSMTSTERDRAFNAGDMSVDEYLEYAHSSLNAFLPRYRQTRRY